MESLVLLLLYKIKISSSKEKLLVKLINKTDMYHIIKRLSEANILQIIWLICIFINYSLGINFSLNIF